MSEHRRLGLVVFLILAYALSAHAYNYSARNPQVVILGGGVAGVIAARTLHENGFEDYLVIDARDQLGGRLHSTDFGGSTVELGANWIQGTVDTFTGRENPIYNLALKFHLRTAVTDWSNNISFFDSNGTVDYWNIFEDATNAYDALVDNAQQRVSQRGVDLTARTGYSLLGWKPNDIYSMASEYYMFDYEYAQTPDESSWIASSWNEMVSNATKISEFSDTNLMAVDSRGFKIIIQDEAKEFMRPDHVLLNSTVKGISYDEDQVQVVLDSGEVITADHAICTFSVGVLQQNDVEYIPKFPAWKREAVQAMKMATYTKIFLKFPEQFWFDTQFGLYADAVRGRYPPWQNMDLEAFLPGSGILFVTVTGDFSENIERMTDDEVQDEVMEVLRSMFPEVDVPDPEDFMFPRWHTNPLFRGSYSNWPPSFYSQHHDNLRANLGRLWFAGEATSAAYFGYLHGAYYEGQAVADRVMECIINGGHSACNMPYFKQITNPSPY
ncbi:amine oxidase [Fistulina hepatica ATCC 64428]|uniref:Amine oxidase n=1 Tax=Fistulina hepatica ATCC 64428 TaxID=1128425 RepID=A0A0D7A891_9AGAR|nr:amine oxidase [Fistulina hepatica ATCC 64428]